MTASRGRSVALLALVPLLAGCFVCVPGRYEVPIPPAGAAPEEVVAAYIDAALGKDSETITAVMVPETDFDEEFNGPFSPFRHWDAAADIEIGDSYAADLDCPPGRECRRVSVSMHLCGDTGHPTGDFIEPFAVHWVKDRWLVSGFGAG
ncbi:hypothetical protein [Herbidospora sp. NBRC 101105]|uniref:hypothetical protein n=1 Tax=Herbidospora sp. NBRC 101105 TaxID=3032195 RepID=UPI00255457DE|nr:hypothetical protein [Herbidospora sp. NBRC 101105]